MNMVTVAPRVFSFINTKLYFRYFLLYEEYCTHIE